MNIAPVKLAVLGFGTAIISLGTYIYFRCYNTKSQKRESKVKIREKCAGLKNVGNTCFANSVLQALASNPSIVDWLQSLLLLQKQDGSEPLSLTSALLRILNVLNFESDQVMECSPREILDSLRRKGWVISGEQDAHEFFHVLAEMLDEETFKFPAVVSLFDTKTLENCDSQRNSCAQSRSQILLPRLPRPTIQNPFKGSIATTLQCTNCSYRYPVKYDTFSSLSMSLPSNCWESVSLLDLLKSFMKCEKLYNVDCQGCAYNNSGSCGDGERMSKSTFIKQTSITKLPDCLCFHIQRNVWLKTGALVKMYNKVNFPEILQMDDYHSIGCSHPSRRLFGGNSSRPASLTLNSPVVATNLTSPMKLLRTFNYQSRSPTNSFNFHQSAARDPVHDQFTDINQNFPNLPQPSPPASSQSQFSNLWKHAYKLTAFISHRGQSFTGHFTTCRRAPSTGNNLNPKWLYTSDKKVRSIDPCNIFSYSSGETYMLFYKRDCH